MVTEVMVSGIRFALIHIPTLPFTDCVAWGKNPYNFFVTQFPHLLNGDYYGTYLMDLGGLTVDIHTALWIVSDKY